MTKADSSNVRMARPGDTANVKLPDGRIRRAQCTNVPDTFFSTPARVSIDGRTVRGWVSLDTDNRYTFTPNN